MLDLFPVSTNTTASTRRSTITIIFTIQMLMPLTRSTHSCNSRISDIFPSFLSQHQRYTLKVLHFQVLKTQVFRSNIVFNSRVIIKMHNKRSRVISILLILSLVTCLFKSHQSFEFTIQCVEANLFT